MAAKTYSTIPSADAQAEEPVLSRDIKVNAKTILAGALAAAFVLGALAAVAVGGGSATPAYELASLRPSTHTWPESRFRLDGKHFPNGNEVCLGVAEDCHGRQCHWKLALVDCYDDPTFLWNEIHDQWVLTYDGLCVESERFSDGGEFYLKPCADTPAQKVGYYGEEGENLHLGYGHYK